MVIVDGEVRLPQNLTLLIVSQLITPQLLLLGTLNVFSAFAIH